MDRPKPKAILISDFNTDGFARCLCGNDECPTIDVTVAPFGQVVPVLMKQDMECWKHQPDFAVVWTQPGAIIKSFNDILNYRRIPCSKIIDEVDAYASLLLTLQDRVGFTLVPTWSMSVCRRTLGISDMKTSVGITNILMRMNLRLSEQLDEAANIHLLDSQKWIELSGRNAFNPKLWYLGKIPFGNQVFLEAAKGIKSALRTRYGYSRKVIVVDLDDTLWGGIVGDIGWKNITLGGHDHIGEAFRDFQCALKSLKNRGILLVIVSKNEETIALEAIENHPEMALRLDDFVGWKINWEDKAKNIVDLISDLNLGLQSVVFVDDSPFERARVREALPEVFVPEWPSDKMLYKAALLNLGCFDTPCISNEDLKRTQMYLSERKRRDLRKKIKSLDEWFKDLRTQVIVEDLNEANIPRIVQLLNRTNQMNLGTRKMTESELISWAFEENNKLWTFRVSDKFGDCGLIGILSLETQDDRGKIVDFALSCRVMGRRVEESMLYVAVEYVRSVGTEKIMAQYVPTERNKPCLDFWKKSGFKFNEKDNCFSWKTKDTYILPSYIELSRKTYDRQGSINEKNSIRLWHEAGSATEAARY